MIDEKIAEPEPQLIGPGKLLQEARNKAELSTKDVAQKLNLKCTIIEQIEDDHYDDAISVTFTRGYLKSYAKLVSVQEDEVLLAFEHLNLGKKEPAKLQSFSRRVANQASDDRLMLVSYLILAVLIALVVMYWVQQSTDDEAAVIPSQKIEEISEEAQVQEITLSAPEVEQVENEEVAEASTASSPDLEISDAVVADAEPLLNEVALEQETTMTEQVQFSDTIETAGSEESVTNTDVEAGQINEPESFSQQNIPLADPVELVFEFSGDCWMDLVDATGEDKVDGVKVSGRVMPVSGIPPFQVILGAPEVVQIYYNGEAVDMSQFRPGRTARFELPLSQTQG